MVENSSHEHIGNASTVHFKDEAMSVKTVTVAIDVPKTANERDAIAIAAVQNLNERTIIHLSISAEDTSVTGTSGPSPLPS